MMLCKSNVDVVQYVCDWGALCVICCVEEEDSNSEYSSTGTCKLNLLGKHH
jgi:hypothetical protein